MINSIKWKVKRSTHKDFDPDLKFIKVIVELESSGQDCWNVWVNDWLDKQYLTMNRSGAIIYTEFVEYNSVTIAALLYLEQLKTTPPDAITTRHVWESQVIRSIETLHTFWD